VFKSIITRTQTRTQGLIDDFGDDIEISNGNLTSAQLGYHAKKTMQHIRTLEKEKADYRASIEKDFSPEDGNINPFLHMGMHLALREQVGTNRPHGIATLTRSLLLKYQDGHNVEHMMIDCLGEMLWNAQRNNLLPDNQAYIECLKHL